MNREENRAREIEKIWKGEIERELWCDNEKNYIK